MVPAQKKQFSLALILGVIITILLVGLGASITFYTYQIQSRKAFVDTEAIFDANSQRTEEKLRGLIHAVESFVTVSSVLEELKLKETDEFFLLLPYFHQSFLNIPWMDSFYVGYENGSFSMIHAIRNNESIRSAFSAPEDTAYVIKNISVDQDAINRVELQFYDLSMQLLQTEERPFAGYDPRARGWYQNAIAEDQVVFTKPYIFFTSRKIGLTISQRLKSSKGVVGGDSSLTSISTLLQQQKLTDSTEIMLSDKSGNILFSSSNEIVARLQQIRAVDATAELNVTDLDTPLASALYNEFIYKTKTIEGGKVVTANGEQWFGHVRHLKGRKNNGISITVASPVNELMVDARAIRLRNLQIMLLVLILAVGFGLYLSRRIATSLAELSSQAEDIRDFKLQNEFSIQTKIREVDRLADTMTVMQSAINRFVEIGRALSAEKNMDKVLELILSEAQSVTRADGGAIGLVTDDEKYFSYVLVRNDKIGIHAGGTSNTKLTENSIALDVPLSQENLLEVSVVQSGDVLALADIAEHVDPSTAIIRQLHEQQDYKCHSLLILPLHNRKDEVIGLLHLVNARASEGGEVIPFPEHKISYVQSLSANAALALDNNRLIRAQQELFNSFVRLIAGAIDTKSPYTGGHCQRVPVIAGLLGDAASASSLDPLKDFQLSVEEKYELFVASWLHDCGKVTTPEFVVDKATKLETNYNRIHEIRTRFEVLRRDAEISYYKGLCEGGSNKEILHQQLEQRYQQLEDDFSFLAECNVGGEYMAPDKIQRLAQIGSETWERYYDDRIGISGEEIGRMDMAAAISLPVIETLLADKSSHIFPRLDGGHPYGDNPLGIVMPVPEYSYNQGELYNLSIAKGTLTEEERYKINDHIVQTINMLNSLPFPKEIRRVPDWAGNHHEKLDGSGYPRCLTGEQLSIPERIMAVADIFEALTAADRPYKAPKKLSTCIKIMSFMRDDGHICPDLFELLLRSGIYKEYAEKYMKPEQIDEVDIGEYL